MTVPEKGYLMKVLQINTVYGVGSTGKIAKQIHDECVKHKIQCTTAYRYVEKQGATYDDTMTISSWLDCHVHNRIVRYSLLQGHFSKFRTLLFLKRVKKYHPDVIHLHNLHGNYIHLGMLFRFIKKDKIPVVWTLHDCWTFTGQCPHFSFDKCEQWRAGCQNCSRYRLSKNVKHMYQWKKKMFTGIEKITLVTPSVWLSDLVKQSFLKDYQVKVICNGINLENFQPTSSDFRKKQNILKHQFMILGVAFDWGMRKGLDVFIELAKRLDHKQYKIVLVGTDDIVDRQLPESIISIHKTENQQELAGIYTVADLFVNPTREDNYPTVNMETIACGTPVITFDAGGSPECISGLSGCVIPNDDIDALEREIIRICNEKPYSAEDCVKQAKSFDMNEKIKEYLKLYVSD